MRMKVEWGRVKKYIKSRKGVYPRFYLKPLVKSLTKTILRPMIILIPLLPALMITELKAAEDQNLNRWKAELWQTAKQAGISQKTFNAAISKTKPNYKLPRVRTHAGWAKLAQQMKKAKKQPPRKTLKKGGLPASCYRPRQKEFLFPTLYFPNDYLNTLITRGKKLRRQYGHLFSRIEKQFGVDMRAVLGIWGRETAYGRVNNRFNGIETLLTLAYASTPEKRAAHRENLITALKFIDEGHISLEDYKTTFAGATGYPQFTPDVFKAYAVDFDGDGRKDIWNSVPDALASTAKYLKGIGWQSGHPWGYEVEVPDGFNCADEGPLGRKPVAEWVSKGVRRAPGPDGKPRRFPDLSEPTQFMAPAGMKGPKFLVTENFEVFRRYNKADLYALFVGHLGDMVWCRNPARCGFVHPWPKQDTFNFTRKRICEMQIHLKHLGASKETPDGLFGGKTRNGIGTFERMIGKSPTCFPSKPLLKTLRERDPLE